MFCKLHGRSLTLIDQGTRKFCFSDEDGKVGICSSSLSSDVGGVDSSEDTSDALSTKIYFKICSLSLASMSDHKKGRGGNYLNPRARAFGN